MGIELDWIVRDASGSEIATAERASLTRFDTGHSAQWHEPGLPSFHKEIPHSYATREVISSPGSKELDGIGSREPWQRMREISLALLSSAAFLPGCDALELRYTATPTGNGPSRVRMFLTAMARDWTPIAAEAAVAAACDALPPGFTWATPLVPVNLASMTDSFDPIIELRRLEEVTEPMWDYIPADFYYTINDDPGDGSGWATFWRMFSESRTPITVSLLFMQTDLHPLERMILGSVVTDLALYAEPRTEWNAVYQQQENFPGCENAKLALGAWHRRIAELRRPLLARIAVRGPLEAATPVATSLAAAIGATSAGGASPSHPMYLETPRSPADDRQARFSFDWLEIVPWGGSFIWEEALAPLKLRRLPYMFGLEEASGLAVLPVPDEQGAPGMPRSRRSSYRRAEVATLPDGSSGLRVGFALHYGNDANALAIPLSAVNRHSLIVGGSGSGKTTTVLTMLAELWRAHHIPFAVIEPSKKEYRGLLDTPGFEDLQVVVLGREDLAPLRMNPMAPPPGVRREVHANAVLASLKLALPLPPPLPQLLDEAIDRAYAIAGWDYDTTAAEGMQPPTLRSLQDAFNVVFAEKSYVGEAKNVGTAFGVRLGTLLRGSRGRALDTVESVDFADLMTRPLVVELDEVADNDDKAILAALLLDRVRAAARGRGTSGGTLQHVTVIEEAHRLLARDVSARGDGASDSARADTVKAFCDAIAELRSVGEGFILSTQSPSDLARAAISNTATRIIHKLEDAPDRKAVLDDLDASQFDREAAARLAPGEAIARWPGRDEAELIRIQPALGIDSGRRTPDEHVKGRMMAQSSEARSLLPFPLCTREICTLGCSAAVRREGEELARDIGRSAAHAWEAANGSVAALDPIIGMLANGCGRNQQLTYCGAAHLAANGQALNVPLRVDIRPELISAVRQL